MNCPKCRYDGIRPQSPTLMHNVAEVFGWKAWKCGGCKHRFYRSASAESKEESKRPRWMRRWKRILRKREHTAKEIAMAALAFALFLVLMKYLMMERNGSI